MGTDAAVTRSLLETSESLVTKNRHSRCAGFFIALIAILILAGCTAPRENLKYSDGVECRESSRVNILTLASTLQDVVDRGKWRGGYDLEDSGQILLKAGDQLVLVGKYSRELKSTYLGLFSDHLHSSFCVIRGRNSGVEYLFIDLPKKFDLSIGPRKYLFVYPNVAHRKYATELEQLSKKIGKILVVQVEDVSSENLLEVRRIVVHEGAHFFGQSKIAHLEPPSPHGDQSSRAYIESLVAHNPDFSHSVQHEFCLARQLFAPDNSSTERNKVAHVKSILIQMLDHGYQRGSLHNTNDQEGYWYFVEGIPQYLEQLIDLEMNPLFLQQRYNRLCATATDAELSLYFNYLGAAILHGLDLISEHKSRELEFFHFHQDNVINFRQHARSILAP
jgi:hypothetical protein